MSTAPETQPDALPPTSPKAPFSRRPVTLIIACAIILILALSLTAVIVRGSGAPVTEAVPASTHSASTMTTPKKTSSATPTPTPTPSETSSAPQASAPQAGSAAAPPAATAPVAAPAPAPPVSAGPVRTAPKPTVTATIYYTTPPNFVCSSPSASIPLTLHWSSTGGTKWSLGDTGLLINNGSPEAVTSSGSRSLSQPCSVSSVDYYFIATKVGTPGTSTRADTTVKPTF